MRIFTAIMVAAAVLATAVVSVRMHLQVAGLRYRVSALEGQHARAEREMRLAQADLDAAKAPRRLMERWADLHGESASVAATERQGRAASPAAPAAPVRPAVDTEDRRPTDGPTDESTDDDASDEAMR